MRTLETALLRLEPQVRAHAPEMFALLCDPAIYAHENAPPSSLAWLSERFAWLESRQSADGQQLWLNWVIRLLPEEELAGYVQATVYPDGRAAIAYEMASRFWGRGLAYAAVSLMLDELAGHYRVRRLTAVLKRSNIRSLRLLQRLGFEPADADLGALCDVEPDEWAMCRPAPTAAP